MYIRSVKEKLFDGEKGVFIGNGRSLFGEESYGSLMAVPMMENDRILGFAIVLKKTCMPSPLKYISCLRH